jgi:hypothetical protein
LRRLAVVVMVHTASDAARIPLFQLWNKKDLSSSSSSFRWWDCEPESVIQGRASRATKKTKSAKRPKYCPNLHLPAETLQKKLARH